MEIKVCEFKKIKYITCFPDDFDKTKNKKYLNKGWSDFVAILNCILGIVFIFLLAFLLSNNKKKINDNKEYGI